MRYPAMTLMLGAGVLLAGCTMVPAGFDSVAWKQSPAGEHPAAMALAVEERGLADGMTFEQVDDLLGRRDSEAIPLVSTPRGQAPRPPDSASLGYGLKGGGDLFLYFTDGKVTRVEVTGQ